MSCSGELNRAFGAEEQLYFQFFLERFDLLADRGLSNAKLFRCSGEALLFGDSREVMEITEFHAESVIDSTYYSNRKAIFHRSQRRVLVGSAIFGSLPEGSINLLIRIVHDDLL